MEVSILRLQILPPSFLCIKKIISTVRQVDKLVIIVIASTSTITFAFTLLSEIQLQLQPQLQSPDCKRKQHFQLLLQHSFQLQHTQLLLQYISTTKGLTVVVNPPLSTLLHFSSHHLYCVLPVGWY